MQLQSPDFFSFCVELASQEKDIDIQLQLLYNSSIFLVHQPILQQVIDALQHDLESNCVDNEK